MGIKQLQTRKTKRRIRRKEARGGSVEGINQKNNTAGCSISRVECKHGKVYKIKNAIDEVTAKHLLHLIPRGINGETKQDELEDKIRENLPKPMKSDIVPGDFIIINPDHLEASFREKILKIVEANMDVTRKRLKIFRAQINIFKTKEEINTRTLIPHADLIDPNLESVAININITKGSSIRTGLWKYNHGHQNSREYGSSKEINEMIDLYIKKTNDAEEVKNNGENILAKNLYLKYWKKYNELTADYLDASMYDGKIFHSPSLDNCVKSARITMAIFLAFEKPLN